MPQFIQPAQAAALCVRFPRVPITQVAERQGSGKITLNKSGSSGTRVWQVPWFFYPAFCDWLLGRTAVNPVGKPQLFRPDVFSPCYPWLYCTEASVEGEDLLGVDLSLRAFYRRAIVTAKYQPLELNNSIHINSQMLTIPNTQFVFIGQNPYNLAGFQQVYGVEIVGKVTGGTFKLGFANDGNATFLAPAIGGGAGTAGPPPPPEEETVRVQLDAALARLSAATTDIDRSAAQTEVNALKSKLDQIRLLQVSPEIPHNASATTVRDALRAALGLTKATDQPGAVTVRGPEGKGGATGPWIVTLNIPQIKTLFARNNTLSNIGAGLYLSPAASGSNSGAQYRGIDFAQWWDMIKGAATLGTSNLYRLDWSGEFKSGEAHFKVTFTKDGKTYVNHGRGITLATAGMMDVFFSLRTALIEGNWGGGSPDIGDNTPIIERTEGAGVNDYGALHSDQSEFMSFPYRDGVPLPTDEVEDSGGRQRLRETRPFSQVCGGDPYHPLSLFLAYHRLPNGYTVSNIELVFTGGGSGGVGVSEPPTLKLTKYDPHHANRLDQNVGKVVPTGEITFQRHQVIATDLVYLLAVVGSVNMFTFMGFPPWTLLLSGIEAKQTRLPNGTPCFDMTFKFAFNPYTHQAIFRPATMRWEFVRGVLVSRVPETIFLPVNPLNPANSRAKINPKAAVKAWAMPDKKLPRVVPVVIDPKSGKPIKGGAGAGAVVGNLAGAAGAVAGGVGGGDDPPAVDLSGGPDAVAGGQTALAATNPAGYTLGDPGTLPAGEFDMFDPTADNAADVSGPSIRLGAPNSNNAVQNPAPAAPLDNPASQIQVPFGTQDATKVAGTTTDLLFQMDATAPADPNAANYSPPDVWNNFSNILGDLIAKSIGVPGAGQADADQKAAASGIEADLELARTEGAPYLSALDAGVAISAGAGGTGNLDVDLAMARIAHECGAKLAPCTREFLGLPPEAETPAGGEAGTLGIGVGGLLTDISTATKAAVGNAVNIGAGRSVQQMSTRVYDVGLIYPICDHTPILWMQ